MSHIQETGHRFRPQKVYGYYDPLGHNDWATPYVYQIVKCKTCGELQERVIEL